MEIYESLSPLERSILPFLNLPFNQIIEKSSLDEISVMRALKFLEGKNLVKIHIERKKIIELGVNGVNYKKNNLPERTLLLFLEKKSPVMLKDLEKHIRLSDNEIKSAIGALKKKALINIQNERISLSANKQDLIRKFPEEELLESLPLDAEFLTQEQKYAFESLEKRKNIIETKEEKTFSISLSNEIREIIKNPPKMELLEQVTPEMIKEGTKSKKFRKYDIVAPVPRLWGGKRNVVQTEIDRAKKIWLEMGFKEMTGRITDSSFWVFDSLFTAQDHPVREMQDTFYIKQMHASMPSDTLVKKVKKAHESGIAGSKGWQMSWNEEEAKKVVLRTHTTSLSARTISNLKKTDLPAKFFAVGKAFRNETIDWSHGIEFYQTEGIVIDEKVNFRNLLGYLKEFYKKMGFPKIRFRPSFFPYTEPSVEIDVFHEGRQQWLELGGAGMMRPEVTVPLFGEGVKILAWGQGLDRIIMDIYKISDLRDLYSNDLKKIRNTPVVP